MPYSEFHFNSAVDGNKVAHQGDRNKRSLELNTPLSIDRFHVRDLELPLTWNNVMTGGQVVIKMDYVTFSWTYALELPPGSYSGKELCDKIKVLLTASTPTREPIAAITDNPAMQDTQFTIDENTGKMVIAGYEVGGNFSFISITWPVSLKKIFGFSDSETAQTIKTSEDTLTTLYRLSLVPNYVYLHSNLMAGTPFFSAHRALGAFTSRTIVTKIQIDSNYDWQEQVMPWVNPHMSSEFMFDCSGREFNTIEFWFTEEDGTLLDFNRISFSLTLSLFYH